MRKKIRKKVFSIIISFAMILNVLVSTSSPFLDIAKATGDNNGIEINTQSNDNIEEKSKKVTEEKQEEKLQKHNVEQENVRTTETKNSD